LIERFKRINGVPMIYYVTLIYSSAAIDVAVSKKYRQG